MPYPPIARPAKAWKVTPNLLDYERERTAAGRGRDREGIRDAQAGPRAGARPGTT